MTDPPEWDYVAGGTRMAEGPTADQERITALEAENKTLRALLEGALDAHYHDAGSDTYQAIIAARNELHPAFAPTPTTPANGIISVPVFMDGSPLRERA